MKFYYTLKLFYFNALLKLARKTSLALPLTRFNHGCKVATAMSNSTATFLPSGVTMNSSIVSTSLKMKITKSPRTIGDKFDEDDSKSGQNYGDINKETNVYDTKDKSNITPFILTSAEHVSTPANSSRKSNDIVTANRETSVNPLLVSAPPLKRLKQINGTDKTSINGSNVYEFVEEDQGTSTDEQEETRIERSTMTEPDFLGPCEPGTAVKLQGIVWQETDKGLLVLNVTWKGKTYVGTLLDCNRQAEFHKWGPPREAPTLRTRSGAKRGRGIRSTTPPVKMLRKFDGKSKDKRKSDFCNGSLSNSATELNSTFSPLIKRGYRRNSKQRRGNSNINGSSRHLKEFDSDQGEQDGDVEFDDEDDDLEDPDGDELNNIFLFRQSINKSPSKSPSPLAHHRKLIECPKTKCAKKFRDLEALKYHLSSSHSDIIQPKVQVEESCSNTTNNMGDVTTEEVCNIVVKPLIEEKEVSFKPIVEEQKEEATLGSITEKEDSSNIVAPINLSNVIDKPSSKTPEHTWLPSNSNSVIFSSQNLTSTSEKIKLWNVVNETSSVSKVFNETLFGRPTSPLKSRPSVSGLHSINHQHPLKNSHQNDRLSQSSCKTVELPNILPTSTVDHDEGIKATTETLGPPSQIPTPSVPNLFNPFSNPHMHFAAAAAAAAASGYPPIGINPFFPPPALDGLFTPGPPASNPFLPPSISDPRPHLSNIRPPVSKPSVRNGSSPIRLPFPLLHPSGAPTSTPQFLRHEHNHTHLHLGYPISTPSTTTSSNPTNSSTVSMINSNSQFPGPAVRNMFIPPPSSSSLIGQSLVPHPSFIGQSLSPNFSPVPK